MVTLEKNVHDGFHIIRELRIAVKDPSRYVLVTDASQAPDDGREALLLNARMECVGANLQSGITSFDLSDTASRSRELLDELERSVYHFACFDLTLTQASDGAWLICGRDDAQNVRDLWGERNVILTALTVSDLTGSQGRTEVFFDVYPSGIYPQWGAVYTPMYSPNDYQHQHATLNTYDGYTYVSVQFKYAPSLPAGITATLSSCDPDVELNSECQLVYQSRDFFNWRDYSINQTSYYQLLFYLDPIPEAPDAIVLNLHTPEEDASSIQVVFRNKDVPASRISTPTPTPVITPAPSATPAAAPTSSADATDRIIETLLEDERVTVTLVESRNDGFWVTHALRVAPRDPSRYVLVTQADQAPEDGREAILMRTRMECVTENLEAGITSFDLSDPSSRSRQLLDELERSVYHLECFDVVYTPQSDGSWLITGMGDARNMELSMYNPRKILTALTLSDLTGTQGRTEVYFHIVPSGLYASERVNYRPLSSGTGIQQQNTVLFKYADYAYLSIQFTYPTTLPEGVTATFTSTDPEVVLSGRCQMTHLHRLLDNKYGGEQSYADFNAFLFYLDTVPDKLDTFVLQLFMPDEEEPFERVRYANTRLSSEQIPKASLASTVRPDATDAVEAQQRSIPEEPSYALATSSTCFYALQKPQKYSHYSCIYRQYSDCTFLDVFFRYHDQLPETAILRITEIEMTSGNYGEAAVTAAELSTTHPADLIGAKICTTKPFPMDTSRFVVSCIDTATDETLFQVTFAPYSGQ